MFQLSRVVIVRIQSNDTSRGLESTNRVAAAGTQGTTHESTTRVSSSLVCSLPLLGQTTAARIREYLITRVVSIQFLCTSDHHRSLPLVRRFHESDALFTHNSSTCIYRRVDRMKGKERLIFA